jgi:acetyl esterase/lipase
LSGLRILAAVFTTTLLSSSISPAIELPSELPLWEKGSPMEPMRHEVDEQVRLHKASNGSPTGQNRAFSSVSSPTYCIHRPEKPNGVGLVICPGGGFRDIWIESRLAPETATRAICPMFIVNARVDKLTLADKCVDFYASLLKADVNAELHVYSKGSHGFGMGKGRGESTALWPTSFVAWLHDCGFAE